jgi:large subunit ribosomal protein L9
MEIILKEDVQKLGHRGDVVTVSPGYARNYLLPTKLAIAATSANKAVIEQMKSSAIRKSASEKTGADAFGQQLNEATVTFERKASESGQLFGSVTSKDIAEALNAQGLTVDRRKIHLDEPLKTVGEYHVPIRIHREVTAHVQVTIKSDAPEVDPNAGPVDDDTAFKSLYHGEVDFQRE